VEFDKDLDITFVNKAEKPPSLCRSNSTFKEESKAKSSPLLKDRVKYLSLSMDKYRQSMNLI
jgi:hypothetical protein